MTTNGKLPAHSIEMSQFLLISAAAHMPSQTLTVCTPNQILNS